MIDKQWFNQLVVLCKFDFCEQSQARFTDDLNAIIEFVGKVKEFDGSYDVCGDGNQVSFADLREDMAISSATPEQLLANTNYENNCYTIPKVVD
jgi:aspartyl/glutamyl-tRNA(Asn/Gln) amidotransferase C subunit